jgi:glutamyl-tRNA(Gln) amidotransferase subunit E
LCSTITNLERQGLNSSLLGPKEIMRTFEFLNQGKITKESIEIIFEQLMSGKTQSVDEAIENTSMITINEDELSKILTAIIQENLDIINKQGSHSIGILMGIAMKSLRGKASGEIINKLLQKMITEYLNKNRK